MIDLRNTYVIVRTQEEYENILKIAEKQGIHWYREEEDVPPVYFSKFPYILRFRSNYIVCFVYENSKLNFKNCKCYEASELIKKKELTAKEFIEASYKFYTNCRYIKCKECKLGKDNTKCRRTLCISSNWKNNVDVDELIEIISDMIEEKETEKEIKRIENSYRTLNQDVVNALEIIIKRLKEK